MILNLDAHSNRKILSMMLEKQHGILSDVAENGLQARDLLVSLPDDQMYDIIFLDNTMPYMVNYLFVYLLLNSRK